MLYLVSFHAWISTLYRNHKQHPWDLWKDQNHLGKIFHPWVKKPEFFHVFDPHTLYDLKQIIQLLWACKMGRLDLIFSAIHSMILELTLIACRCSFQGDSCSADPMDLPTRSLPLTSIKLISVLLRLFPFSWWLTLHQPLLDKMNKRRNHRKSEWKISPCLLSIHEKKAYFCPLLAFQYLSASWDWEPQVQLHCVPSNSPEQSVQVEHVHWYQLMSVLDQDSGEQCHTLSDPLLFVKLWGWVYHLGVPSNFDIQSFNDPMNFWFVSPKICSLRKNRSSKSSDLTSSS